MDERGASVNEEAGAPVEHEVGSGEYDSQRPCCKMVCLAILFIALPVGPVVAICQELRMLLVLVEVILFGAILLYSIMEHDCADWLSRDTPQYFELSEGSLVMKSWRGTIGVWHASAVQSVHVYKKSFTGHGWLFFRKSRRAAVEAVENVESLRCQLQPYPLFCTPSTHHYTCAFLGVQIVGMEDIVPLTQAVWHKDGLDALFDLSMSVRDFQEGFGFSTPPTDAFDVHRGATDDLHAG